MKHFKINLIAAIILLVLSLSLNSCNSNTREQSQNTIGQPTKAPNFELASLDGKQISLQNYSGKYLVVHIATTWCPYCNAEMPHLEELYKNYKDQGVEVIVIDVKEPHDLVKEKLQDRFNMQIPILMDLDGKVAASFAPDDVLPELARDEIMLASNIIINPQGEIIFMSLLDTKNFDTELIELKKILDANL